MQCSGTNSYVVSTWNQSDYYRADKIIPNSFSQEKYLLSLGKSWSKKVQTIINYTETEVFNKISIPKNESIIKIGVFARFSRQKNALGLVEAVSTLIKKNVKPFEIHWFGDQRNFNKGYNQDYLKVRDEITEKRVDKVFLLHELTRNVCWEMNKLHAICLPSFYEGFSNSVSEGICCGKPMLVSNVSDNSIMVHEGENGFLFNPYETTSIVAAFERFLSLSSKQMEEMGEKSRTIAKELFNKDKYIEKYQKIIEE